jgi:acetyl esterase
VLAVTQPVRSPLPVEPEILAYQRRVDAFYPPDAIDAPIEQQRAWYDELCQAFAGSSAPGVTFGDETLATPDGSLRVRRYQPSRITAGPVVVYLHGGGFVVGGVDSHHGVCLEICAAAAATVVAVSYRLAPEHPWPAPFDDCRAVVEAEAARAGRVIVAGDSAGAALAAGVTLWARDAQPGRVAGQVLIYPGLGGDLDQGSYVEMADTIGLTTREVAYYQALLAAPVDAPYAAPLKADLTGLPPAFISAAHFDPLRDDARRYAARLALAGCDVAYREEPQMIHGWLRARAASPGAARAFAALLAAISTLCAAGR